MAQRVEVFGDNSSPLPRTYVMEGRKEPTPTNCPQPSHMDHGMHTFLNKHMNEQETFKYV